MQASPTAAVGFFVSQPRLCNASPVIHSDVSFLFFHIKHTVPRRCFPVDEYNSGFSVWTFGLTGKQTKYSCCFLLF